MIRIENLTKNYGDVKAVQSISFSLNDGEIVGFLGANGAGKSTTLKMMTGYLSPTSGNVFVNDQNIIDDCIDIQKQIGYLPELNPLYFEMKVHEYLKFHAEVRGIKESDFNDSLKRVVSECGLQGVVHRTVGNCSKGYKQRIGLAAALIHDPKVLILDEPVTGLDPNQIVEIRGLIKKLGKRKLVLMSSHILQEIQATVDRIIIIDKGKIVADGTSEELISDSKGITKLKLEILEGDENDIKNMEATIPSLKVKSINKYKESVMINIEYQNSSDPRKDLFQYAIEKNWVITEMSLHKRNLEDLFRNLTLSKGEETNA
ncbi:ATP-binding cassette domain-containing protein [Candidatus Marinimicrobia bacterium]|mgnify:FL=1|nr:ATP-binding cassette domain-containing protein [Candidatus Neomarinimicrobiota bacterium]